jgi:hypothetical protein
MRPFSMTGILLALFYEAAVIARWLAAMIAFRHVR